MILKTDFDMITSVARDAEVDRESKCDKRGGLGKAGLSFSVCELDLVDRTT